MIISDKHKFVYIGIPRTASKSMNHWLCSYFDGRSHAGHHDYLVPEDAKDYLIFTVVRNPYDRAVSGHFGVTWGGATLQEGETPLGEPDYSDCQTPEERCRRLRDHLERGEKRERRDMPTQSHVPLEERIRAARELNESRSHGMNQKGFVDLAGVKLVLHLERFPGCLKQLPFVDADNMPPFPHHPERGIRPEGSFFDLFAATDEEEVIWAHGAEDFEAFGYRRFEAGLPQDAPDAVVMTR